MKWPTKVFRSVFTKLLLISLFTWIALLITVVAVLIHQKGTDHPFKKSISQYLNYVVADLGEPPSKLQAISILEKTGLRIAYSAEEKSWSTLEAPPPIEKITFRPFPQRAELSFGGYRGRHFFKLTRPKESFLIEFTRGDISSSSENNGHIVLLLLLTIIIIAAYFAVKRVLKPITNLQLGVEEVGRGNFSHEVPEKSKDEFGSLTTAFNSMTRQIQGRINLKEQLLRDVSHELRSPLTRIKVSLEFLENSEEKQSISEDILEMEEMIGSILENARLHHKSSQLELKEHSLSNLVSDIVEKYRNQWQHLELNINSQAQCNLDINRMKWVVSNILDNSIKYSDKSNSLIKITVIEDHHWAMVTIEDQGIGIPPEKIPMIQEPFYRLDQSRSKETGGYGLGLSLCKTIMEAHGGKIEIQSCLDQGTTVRLFLPRERF